MKKFKKDLKNTQKVMYMENTKVVEYIIHINKKRKESVQIERAN